MFEVSHISRRYDVLRLSARSKNNQIRFNERFLYEDMNVTDRQLTLLPQVIRTLHERHDTGVFKLDGVTVYAAWNPASYEQAMVEKVLWKMFDDQLMQREPPGFNRRALAEQQTLIKQRRELRQRFAVNAWLELDHGLFWTWEKINLKDLALNLAREVAWLDLSASEKRAQSLQHLGRPTLEAKMGPLRDQLLRSK